MLESEILDPFIRLSTLEDELLYYDFRIGTRELICIHHLDHSSKFRSRRLQICEPNLLMVRFEEGEEYGRDIGTGFLGVSCLSHETLIEVTRETIIREDTSIISDELECFDIANSSVDRKFLYCSLCDIFARESQWRKVWIWKVSIVHSIFLGPQRSGESFLIIPSSSLLIDLLTILIEFTLTVKLDIDGTPDRGERVDILEFDTIAECGLSSQSY